MKTNPECCDSQNTASELSCAVSEKLIRFHIPPTFKTAMPFRRSTICFLILAWCLAFSVASAQDSDPPKQVEFDCQVGFLGKAKLGHWLPITIETDSAQPLTDFRATALDGDDTPSIVSGKLFKVSGGNPDRATYQAWTQIGRTYGSLIIELLANEQVVASKTIGLREPGNGVEIVSSTAPMILTLAPTETGGRSLASIIESMTLIGDDENAMQILELSDYSTLPINWYAMQGVETVLITTSDMEKIKSVDPRIWNSLHQWVSNGGHLVISASPENSELCQPGQALHQFTPGDVTGSAMMNSSRRIEDFSASREQLIPRGGNPVPIVGIENVDGQVALQQDGQPLIIRSAVGFGEIDFLTLDLDSERISQWGGFVKLVQQMVQRRASAEELLQSKTEARRGSAVRHYGYRDLVGQLKVPLDQFSLLKFIPFMLIATLIGLYILCIGPGDFFLLNRLVKKPELTWITFPLITALFCGLAWWIANYSRPKSIQLNQLEVVDYDSVSNRVRGTTWANLYSPNGSTADLGMRTTHSSIEKVDSSVVTWLGLPGDGLGGMKNQANPGLFRSGYDSPFEIELEGDEVTSWNSSIENVSLQVSSTKPLFVQWHGDSQVDFNSRLKVTDRLEGTFVNPFDVPLTNCRLFFDGWVYVVRGSMAPGLPVDLRTETTEKTVKSLMTRRTQTEKESSRSQNLPWDPTDTNMVRIANMMMFYQAGGGQEYTGLTHSFHRFIDMSPNLKLQRAILVGELKKDTISELTINGEDSSELYDTKKTIVRIVLPVDFSEDSRR
jgi:hypothetical protein